MQSKIYDLNPIISVIALSKKDQALQLKGRNYEAKPNYLLFVRDIF